MLLYRNVDIQSEVHHINRSQYVHCFETLRAQCFAVIVIHSSQSVLIHSLRNHQSSVDLDYYTVLK